MVGWLTVSCHKLVLLFYFQLKSKHSNKALTLSNSNIMPTIKHLIIKMKLMILPIKDEVAVMIFQVSFSVRLNCGESKKAIIGPIPLLILYIHTH